MSRPERCDAAVWDVCGRLLDPLRESLRGRVQREGPRLMVDVGEAFGQRIAIGRPRRLIAAQAPSLQESLGALIAAHRPGALIVVGPAAGEASACSVGDVRVELDSPTPADGSEGPIGTGPTTIGGEHGVVTTDWAACARQAHQADGVHATLIAVVTVLRSGESIVPPASRPPTQSRRIGRFLGKLVRGEAPGDSIPPECLRAAQRAIEKVLSA